MDHRRTWRRSSAFDDRNHGQAGSIANATQRIGWLPADGQSSGGKRVPSSLFGLSNNDPMTMNLPDAVSVLLFTYPTEATMENGLQNIVTLHNSLVERLPIINAYTSPAFLYATGAGEPAAFQAIRRLCRRYSCIDIPYMSIDCFEIGNKVRGAYWLNYLGVGRIHSLGGTETLQAAGVTKRSLAGGATALQVSSPPCGGDINRREDMSAYNAIATFIRPLQYTPSVSFPEFELEDAVAWFRRFDTPPT